MLKYKIINLFRNYIWMLACYFLFFLALGFVQVLFPDFGFTEYQQNDINRMLLENPLQFFLLAVIIAPVIEEGMFRTIIKPTNNELMFFISCWLVVLISSFIPVDVHWAVKVGFLLVFLIFSFVVLRELIPVTWQWKTCAWLKKYHLPVWLITSILFGFIHIYNYVEGFELNFVLFLLIFPRIIAGVFFGKIKLENRSLLWPVALHAMNNGAVLLLLLPQVL